MNIFKKLFHKHKFYYSKKKSWLGAGKGDSVVNVSVYQCRCGEIKSNKKYIG